MSEEETQPSCSVLKISGSDYSFVPHILYVYIVVVQLVACEEDSR